MFCFDEDQEDNGFDVATPLSDPYRSTFGASRTPTALASSITSTATTTPAGIIHNTFCTTQEKLASSVCHQNLFASSINTPAASKAAAAPSSSLFASTTATKNVVGDADWRNEELLLLNTSTKTSTPTSLICGKQVIADEIVSSDNARKSFYVGDDESEDDQSDSDFEDEIESLIDENSSSEDDEHSRPIFALDDDSGIGTISTEPSLEDETSELCEEPSELISLPRSIRIGSVGRRMMRTPRGRKQRLQFTDFYELTQDHLGQGAYASVRTCIQKSTRKEFAVKLVNKHEPGHTRSKILREVDTFKMCKGHPNIVQLVSWFEDDKYYYMVFEKMRGGPLLNHIQAKSCFTEEEASQVTKDIAMALKFLHDKGVAHRDIKPENILCTELDRVSPVKICDLDLASKPPSLSKYSKRTDNHGSENSVSRSLPVVHSEPDLASPVGSAEFLAPEVVEAFIGDKFKYDKKCDTWALGVVIYVMLCGYPPFYGQCDNENCNWAQGEACDDCQQNLFERIQKGEFDFPEDEGWADISEDAKDLIRHLLVKDVRVRYTADEVLKHPWVVHEAPQTPLQTANNLIYRNDSARDISMMNENFNAINRFTSERLGNELVIDEGETSSSTGSPPSPTILFPGNAMKSPHMIPIHTPSHLQAPSNPFNQGFYVPVSQPQVINMNGMMIYAPPMAHQHFGYTPEIRNGTTYYLPNQHQHPHQQQHQQHHQATSSPHAWYSSMPNNNQQQHFGQQPPPNQHQHFNQQQQSQMMHHHPRSLDQLNGAIANMGLETCQNAMNRQDSKNDIHNTQTRETQVNV